MSQRFLSVVPAAPGFHARFKPFVPVNTPELGWSPWFAVIAWGITEFGGREPVTVEPRPAGGISDWHDVQIRKPDGKVIGK